MTLELPPTTIRQQAGSHLYLRACVSDWHKPIAEIAIPAWLRESLRTPADGATTADPEARLAMRNLLRVGGFKPTGRNKPASEYLMKAAAAGTLRSINAAVDACNAASLRSAMAMSVVDLDKIQPPLSVKIVADGNYVFNPSGQTLELGGLICLCDSVGPCANAVKDSQRTKTSATTRRTLSLVWGPADRHTHVDTCMRWYLERLNQLGATSALCRVVEAAADGASVGS